MFLSYRYSYRLAALAKTDLEINTFNYVCITYLKHTICSLLDLPPDCLLVTLNSWVGDVGDISDMIENNPRLPGLFFNRRVV